MLSRFREIVSRASVRQRRERQHSKWRKHDTLQTGNPEINCAQRVTRLCAPPRSFWRRGTGPLTNGCERHLPKPRKPETPTSGNPEIRKSDLACSYGETGRRVSALCYNFASRSTARIHGQRSRPGTSESPSPSSNYRQRPLIAHPLGAWCSWAFLLHGRPSKQKRETMKTRKPESGEY